MNFVYARAHNWFFRSVSSLWVILFVKLKRMLKLELKWMGFEVAETDFIDNVTASMLNLNSKSESESFCFL